MINCEYIEFLTLHKLIKTYTLCMLLLGMAGIQLNAKDIFTKNYSALCDTLTDIDNLLKRFVSAEVIKPGDLEKINAVVTKSKKVEELLSHIYGPLEAGDTKGFQKMLTIMEEYGSQSTKDLAVKMKSELRTFDSKVLHEG